MEHLQSFIKDCDRKIQIAKKRLEETQDDHEKVPEVCSLHFFFPKLNTHHHYSLIRLQWILPSDEWLFAGHSSHLHTVIRQGRTLCD